MTNETQRVGSQGTHVSPFERIKHVNEFGSEYWSARELSRVLGYTEYGKFRRAVEKAIAACRASGQTPSDHFAHVSDMIQTGKGAQRAVPDIHLSRYASYLIVQNADPTKEIVALGQTYFAVQTRRAELADELAGLTEDQKRIRLRQQMREHKANISSAANDVGVITDYDFAIFHDHGYRGLYGGESARDIGRRKNLKPGQRILDWMFSEELADNLFVEVQTEARLRREEIAGKDEANRIHFETARAVRSFIINDLHGTPPELLPTPAESIQAVERRERKRIERERQPLLFADEPPEQED